MTNMNQVYGVYIVEGENPKSSIIRAASSFISVPVVWLYILWTSDIHKHPIHTHTYLHLRQVVSPKYKNETRSQPTYTYTPSLTSPCSEFPPRTANLAWFVAIAAVVSFPFWKCLSEEGRGGWWWLRKKERSERILSFHNSRRTKW